jgi:tetratricopeptide (TPR) repeat protein
MLVELEKLAPPLPGQTPEVAMAAESAELAELRLPTAGGVPSLVGGGTAGFVDLLLQAAWALRDAGRDPEAANLFRRVVAYDPGHQEALAALLHLYGTAEERASAAASAAVRRQGETDPVRLFEEGSDLLGAGELESAFPLLQRAAPQLEAGPYAEPAWYNLGTAAFRLKKWQEAVKAFEQAIAVNPERSESHFKLGVARYHLGKCSEVIPALRRALELAPTKRDAHGFLAACYRSLGDAAAAAREDALSGSSN